MLPHSAAVTSAVQAMQSQVAQISSFLPHFVGKGLEAAAATHGRAGRRRGGPSQGLLQAQRLSREFLLSWPRGSRVFHKYLQKDLKDCSLQLSIHCTNLCTTLFLLTPQNQRTEDLGAFDLGVNALF